MAYLRWRSGLTGGTINDLDGIDGLELSAGDVTIVTDTTRKLINVYVVESPIGVAESSPFVILPGTNPGTKGHRLYQSFVSLLIDSTLDAPATAPALDADSNKSIVMGDGAASKGDYNTVLGGKGNTIVETATTNDYGVVVGGESNSLNGATHGAVMGGKSNVITNSTHANIVGGLENTIGPLAKQSHIGGGYSNEVSNTSGYGEWNVIGGGNDNKIAQSNKGFIGGGHANLITGCDNNSAIGGGYSNEINACNKAVIAGGDDNEIVVAAHDAAIGGGCSNSISDSDNAVIGGGYDNAISQSSDEAVIAGGRSNEIYGTSPKSAIVGGDDNSIITGSVDSFIGAGYSNLINASDHGVIGGGYNNAINAKDYAFVGGGKDNQVSGHYGSIPGGANNLVYGDYARACGKDARSYLHGESAESSGMFSERGDAQVRKIQARNITTDATETALFLDGAAILPYLTSNFSNSVLLTAKVIAREIDSTNKPGDSAWWEIKAMLEDIGDYGITYLIGSASGTGTPAAGCFSDKVSSQGTISITGLPVADQTVTINADVYTWKASAVNSFEVEIGADAAACAANLLDAIMWEPWPPTYTAEDGGGNTIIVTALVPGVAGDSIVFSETSDNLTMDGSGFLGGTTAGADSGKGTASTWEVDLIDGQIAEYKTFSLNVTGEAGKTIHWMASIELVEVG